MTTFLFTHPDCFDHDTGGGHPESPARLRAVLDALSDDRFAALVRREAPLADREIVALAHPRSYVDAVLAAVPADGFVSLDPDTVVSPGSGEAALRAAGASIAAVDAVLTGDAKNAFCAVRPPGHHAEPARAMGFCLFNGVVVAAKHAMARHGLSRVAIVDFDVHHGNGTQTAAEADAALFYGSSHQYPFYPGTGAAGETGQGNVLNLPVPAGASGAALVALYAQQMIPALDKFRPELLIISAGFDAHRDDPLGGLLLVEADFVTLTEQLLASAARLCDGRVVSVLEGGYDLAALGRSAAAHVDVLMAA
jgi:acetoin utilization deacetylase AcuC-like enzyme